MSGGYWAGRPFFMYAADAVSAYLTPAKRLDRPDVRGEAFNAGMGRPVSAPGLAEHIIALSGHEGLRPRILSQSTPQGEIDVSLRETPGWYARFLKTDGGRSN